MISNSTQNFMPSGLTDWHFEHFIFSHQNDNKNEQEDLRKTKHQYLLIF